MLYYKGLVQKRLSNLTTLVCSMGMCLKRIVAGLACLMLIYVKSIGQNVDLFCLIAAFIWAKIKKSSLNKYTCGVKGLFLGKYSFC